tara:strand:+ start:43 stop:1299 length:1257 start_codon:yes stop_codon:yes gene_type:complete
MAFKLNGTDVMSKYDTTYASERLTAVSGFKINGTDIGKSATPGVDGYTTDDPDTNDAFKTSNVSFNQLFSTSKPLVIVHNIYSGGKWTNRTVDDYIFRENKAYTSWRNMIRLTIPNIPGVQIPLRILLVGGGGGGGSGGAVPDGSGGGGAGTYLDLTMTLNETHDQHYFYGKCASAGGGGGYGGDDAGEAGEMGGDTYLRFQNTLDQAINQYVAEGGAGGGGNANSGHAKGDNGNPDDGRRGSGGGASGAYSGTNAGGTAGNPTYLEDIWITDEHPTTSIVALANNGGTGYQGGGNPGGGGGGAGSGGGNGNTTHNVGGGGGAGYTWINGVKYAGGGAGGRGRDRDGHYGAGDRTAGAGCRHDNKNYLDAVDGTGSGGMGYFDWWYERTHGGNGGDGFIGIGIPRIFTDANHHTFTPL